MDKFERNKYTGPKAIFRKDGIILNSVPVEGLPSKIPLFATLYCEICDGYPSIGIKLTKKMEDQSSFPVSLFIDCPDFISDIDMLRCDLARIASYDVKWDPEDEILLIEDLPCTFNQE
jgi:hypothetical protein